MKHDASPGDASPKQKPLAILDSSFWTVAFGARVEVFLPRFFNVAAPAAVYREVVDASTSAFGATYPYAEGFRLWWGHGLIGAVDPQVPWPAGWGPEVFQGKGENAVLRVAREQGGVVLVNESPAWEYARARGLTAVNVPEFILLAVSRGSLAWGTGWNALNSVDQGHRTTARFVETARAVLHARREVGGDV